MAAPTSHSDSEFRGVHTADVTHCDHCRSAIVDINESILREIEIFAAFNGFEDIISELISKKLGWLVQKSLQHGISIGRRTQMEEDKEMMAQYRQGLLRMRQERDEVKERHRRYQERVITNTKEIQSIRNTLNALSWVDSETALTGSPEDHDLTQESPIHLDDLGEASVQKALELTPISQNEDEHLTISEALVLYSSDSSLAREEPEPLHDHEQSDTSDIVVAPENWMAPSNDEDNTVNAQSSATKSENEHLAIEILRSISALDINMTPTAAVNTDELKVPPTVDGMKHLLQLTRQKGNLRAVKEARRLLAAASQTRKAIRTEAQTYLIKNWKVPKYIRDAKVVDPLPLYVDASVPEIVVDASNHGVGFIFKNVGWLGWTFKSSPSVPIPIDSNDNIIMSWAELIAVELGVRAYVEVGFHSCNLLLRSDNQGVIKALKDKVWQEKYDLNNILKRILKICKKNGITIMPRWISTDENPADDISRGIYPRREPKLWATPTLPPMLAGIVQPVS